MPFPLGVQLLEEEGAYRFALYSKHATAVTLLLFAADDATRPLHEEALHHLRNKTGRVWHCRLPAASLEGALHYAYRVQGPFDLLEGHRFDTDKILLDPYARELHFPPGFQREAAARPGSNAGRAPLGVLPRAGPAFDWGADRPLRHAHDAVIYELHVRGFTQHPSSGVAPERRGTFLGVIDKIPYLRDLGVTVVELMPVFQFDPGERNYWGYMPLSFFAPHQAYATRPERARDEFREMVKALHAAEIEVVLDVVYNHTTEKGAEGPCYSYRGLDNTTYYLLHQDRARYRDDAGTGNVLHTANRYVRTMVLDSLRYWAGELHVDGFRFDLASIFTRRSDGTVDLEDPPILSAIGSDPVLSGRRLIAEAWDVAAYQLGRSFPGYTWLQWNGRFRDDLRGFVRGEPGLVGALMTRLYGSDDLFPDALPEAYRPFQSVNFVTCHDGFILRDLVSYEHKRNLANGHDNRDGAADNRSWNCGWEGDEGAPPEVVRLRRRQMKNFCALLLLANGTPMFCAGEEFAHTQGGNNNPYNQDNESTWVDWSNLQEEAELWRFFQRTIAFRKRHPSIARSRYWREDVRWYGTGPSTDLGYPSRSLAYCLHGASQDDDDLYVMISSYWEALEFTFGEGAAGEWLRVLDTGLAAPDDVSELGTEPRIPTPGYVLQPRSVAVFLRKRT